MLSKSFEATFCFKLKLICIVRLALPSSITVSTIFEKLYWTIWGHKHPVPAVALHTFPPTTLSRNYTADASCHVHSFSLLRCKTAGFKEIIGLCLNPRQLLLRGHSLQYFCLLGETYGKHFPPEKHCCFVLRCKWSNFASHNNSFVVPKYTWKLQQVQRVAEQLLSSFQAEVLLNAPIPHLG